VVQVFKLSPEHDVPFNIFCRIQWKVQKLIIQAGLYLQGTGKRVELQE